MDRTTDRGIRLRLARTMTDEFVTVCRILQFHGLDLCHDYRASTETAGKLESDADYMMWHRTAWEAQIRGPDRATGERLVRLLHNTAVYVSNLLDGPVPVLLPRAEVRTLHDSNGDGRGAALTLGRAVQQVVQTQLTEAQEHRDERLLAEIEHMVAHAGFRAVPANKKHLHSTDVAGRLGLHAKTVRRLGLRVTCFRRRPGRGGRRTSPARP